LLTSIFIPARSSDALSTFLKLGHRRYLVISIVMVAIVLDFDVQKRVSYCGVSVGACSAAACRLPVLERGLTGVARSDLCTRATHLLDAGALAPLAPVDDVRSTREYRLDVARCLIERALAELVDEAGA
jgi:CO/xanthine dehydrogenase FAD-binding subunit